MEAVNDGELNSNVLPVGHASDDCTGSVMMTKPQPPCPTKRKSPSLQQLQPPPPKRRISSRIAIRVSSQKLPYQHRSSDYSYSSFNSNSILKSLNKKPYNYQQTRTMARTLQSQHTQLVKSRDAKDERPDELLEGKDVLQPKNSAVKPIVIKVNKSIKQSEKKFSIKRNVEESFAAHGKVSTRSAKKVRTSDKGKMEKSKVVAPKMSEYEKQIQQNIEDRKKMFKMLKLDEAKQELQQICVNSPISTPQSAVASSSATKAHENNKPKRRLMNPVRRSTRTARPVRKLEESFLIQVPKKTTKEAANKIPPRSTSMPNAAENEERADFMRCLLPQLKVEKSTLAPVSGPPETMDSFLHTMETLTNVPDDSNVVTLDGIHSLSWHPSSNKLFLAAGDQKGNIGFWDVDRQRDMYGGVRIYDIHTGPIYSLSFDERNPSSIWSTSYDFVHLLDLRHDSFDEMYSVDSSSDTVITYHVQRDANSLLVSQSNGEVVVIDVRCPGRAAMRSKFFDGSIRTLSKHPCNENVFLAASSRHGTGVFDLRRVTARPLTSFPISSVTVQGAAFSPKTGRLVLQYGGSYNKSCTTSIFDIQNGSEACGVTNIEHSYCYQKAGYSSWHPNREDVFIVGESSPSRGVHMIDALSGEIVHEFIKEDLNSMCLVNAFHPSVPVLASGNNYGRIHVFRSHR